MKGNIAIIPARGGSKRIPRKNIKDFLGKPIIAYSIEAALESALFEEVMVSTDDAEIAAVAARFGAKVPFTRSAATSNDFATTFQVIEEVIREYGNLKKEFLKGCCIYPTAPFVSPKILSAGLALLSQYQYDSVFPVMKFSYPIQRALKKNSEGKMEMFYPEMINARSQDLEAAFHDAGQFYWFDVATLQKKQKLWTNNTGIIEIRESEGQDIDTAEDWKLAEHKFQLLQKRN